MTQAKSGTTISFRARKQQIERLDACAKRQRRDRTQLIGDAIEQYIALHEVHLERIDEGIAAAERGDFASDAEVRAEFARWRRRA